MPLLLDNMQLKQEKQGRKTIRKSEKDNSDEIFIHL